MKTITKLTITSHLFNQSIGTLGNRIKKIPPSTVTSSENSVKIGT
jgi:hypothetical protein